MIPNQKLLQIVDKKTTIPEAFRKADAVLQQAVQGITDLINVDALINLDFADVCTVMRDKGVAHIGIGYGKGDNKAEEAVKQAISSPLLETTITGATDIIFNITGDVSLMDSSLAGEYVQELAGENVNIIFGARYDENMSDEVIITVIATGLDIPAETAESRIPAKAVRAANSAPSAEEKTPRHTLNPLGRNSGNYFEGSGQKSGTTEELKDIVIPSFLNRNK